MVCFKFFSNCVGFEILTAVVMKSSTYRDIAPCNPNDVLEEYVTSIFRIEV
jgi:hypothetical protein